MDTPFPTLSAEEFDALVSNQSHANDVASPVDAAQLPPSGMAGSAPLGLPAHLLQALAWSLELAPQVMTNLVSRAMQSMDRTVVSLAGTEPAQALEGAAVEMESQRTRWAQQYTALLRVAMAYPATAKMAAILPKVDLRICAAETLQLDALVQAQFEALPAMRGNARNPLGPQAYVQALLELIARSQAHPAHRQIWANHLLAALSSQLAWVYLQLHAVLRDPSSREASVLAAADGFEAYAAVAYGFTQASEDLAADSDEAGAGMNTQTQQLAGQARRTVQRLRKQLGLPEQADSADDAMAQASGGNPMDALLHDLDVAEQLMAQIRERGLPMPSMDDESDTLAVDAEAVLAEPEPPAQAAVNVSEVQIVEFIKTYQNTTSPSLQRVPVPLREALQDLQQPLLVLAQSEPQLLTDDAHPAQQFLILITQRSLQYSSEMAEGFAPFMAMIDKVMDALAAMRQPSARGFEQACNSLRTVWQRQDDAAAMEDARKAKEFEQMQTAKALAGRVGFELVGRRDAGDAPPMIKQFLMGPWAQVLARAQLFAQHEGDVQRYTQALSGLLWSVSLRRAAPRKHEHAALVLQLAPQLAAGLQSINMPEVQANALLSDIKKLQDAVQVCVVADDAEPSVSDAAPLLAA